MIVLSRDARVRTVFHIADLHVSTDSERTEEYAAVFDDLLRRLAAHESTRAGTALLVVAGDVLHNKCRASTDGARLLFGFLNRCLALFPVLLICGNHDYRQDDPGVTDAVDMLVAPYAAQGTPHAIHYLATTGLYTWGNLGFGVVSVKDTLRSRNTAGIVDRLPDYPDPAGFGPGVECRVALFHGTVCASVLAGDARGFTLSSSYPLAWFRGYDVGMFGDNHTQQVATDRSVTPAFTWAYPGSLVQQTFGEGLHGHGYVEWYVPTRSATPVDVPNDRGRFTMVADGPDGSWTVVPRQGHRVPLRDLEGRLPARARVRVVGDRVRALEALRAAGVPSPTIFPYRGAATEARDGSPRAAPPPVPPGFALDSPDAWTRFFEEASDLGLEMDGGFRDMLAGRDLQLPASVAGVVSAAAFASQNAAIARMQEDLAASLSRAVAEPDVELLRLEWSWLLCFGPDNTFDFEAVRGKVALLNGPNASGKSSFLHVLLLAVFGEAHGADSRCNARPSGGAPSRTRLVFRAGDVRYEVRREFSSRQAARGAKHSATVHRVLGDGGLALEGEGAVKVRDLVTRFFGTADAILSGVMVQQGDTASFFHQKPCHRRETLEAALNMEAVNRYQALLKRAVHAHDRALVSCEAMIREKDAAVAAAAASRAEAAPADDLRGRLDAASAALRDAAARHAVAPAGVDAALAEAWAARDAGESDEALLRAEAAAARELMGIEHDPDQIPAIPQRRRALSAELQSLPPAPAAPRPRADDVPALEEESARVDAGIPRGTRPPDAAAVRAWHDSHRDLMGIAPTALGEELVVTDALRTHLAARRDALMGTAFLRGFIPPDGDGACDGDGDGDGPPFDAASAWDLKRRADELALQWGGAPPDPGRAAAWLRRYPTDWTRDDAARVLERARGLEVDILFLEGRGAEWSPGGALDGIGARLRELRAISAASDAHPDSGAPVGGPEHREFLCRDTSRRRDLERLGGRTAAGLEADLLRARMDTQADRALRRRVEELRREAHAELDINPECRACLARESYRRRARARSELDLGEEELRVLSPRHEARLAEREQTLARLHALALDVERTADGHAAELAGWLRAEAASDAKLETAAELRALEEVASGTLDRLRRDIASAEQDRRAAEEFLDLEGEMRRQAVAAALAAQALAWRRELEATETRAAEVTARADRVRRFAEARGEMEAWAEWAAARRDIDARLAEARLAARAERAALEEAALRRLERARDLRAELARVRHVLAHRRWRAAEAERARLTEETRALACTLAVAEEREAADLRRRERLAELRRAHGELGERTSRMRRLYDAFAGDGSGGFKAWLYRTRVAPFLEREVNALVQEVDDFRFRVDARRGDDLAFSIEDRGSSPPMERASGYQRFVLNLAMRLALSRMGAPGHRIRHMFVDEGFAACDATNIRKTRLVLETLMRLGGYHSVVIASHIEAVREAADVDVRVERRPLDPVSRISLM
eukprot:jgi/Tetstr1/454212/TSEL_041131.t1